MDRYHATDLQQLAVLMRYLIAGLVLLLGLALRSHSRVFDWQSDRTLWASAVRVEPLSPRAWINLGRACALELEDRCAFDAYHRGYALAAGRWDQDRAQAVALANLAVLWHERGDNQTALRDLQQAETKHLPDRMVISLRAAFAR